MKLPAVRTRTTRCALLVLLAALGLVLAPGAGARAQAPREVDLLAELTVRLTRFVQWPRAAFPDPDQPFAFGVLGDPARASALERALRGRTIAGRAVAVVHGGAPADLIHCHLVFVLREGGPPPEEVVAALERRPILLVGTAPGFAAAGGVLGLGPDRRARLRLEVNPEQASRRNLGLDPAILRYGERVPRARR